MFISRDCYEDFVDFQCMILWLYSMLALQNRTNGLANITICKESGRTKQMQKDIK